MKKSCVHDGDQEINEDLDDQPFDLRDIHFHDKEHETSSDKNNHKRCYIYKAVTEQAIFKEDDRDERPFVIIQQFSSSKKIRKVWLAIINLKNNKIVESVIVNLSSYEMAFIESTDNIQMCSSKSIVTNKNLYKN